MKELYFLESQVIVAQATPIGKGSLAIIRVSGENSLVCANLFVFLSSKRFLSDVSQGIYHGRIMDQDRLVDEVMVAVFKAPKSFTGENALEITCHNNQIIVKSIIDLFIKFGARIAEPGEFSKRAFLNGKIDLLQAEAICEIISAQTQAALARSLQQLQGSLSSFLHEILQEMLGLLAYLEASFEFGEEDHLDLDIEDLVASKFNLLQDKVRMLKLSSSQDNCVRDGVKIIFCGPPNVGKSTLFNTLLRRKRAIVSDIPGTTRDTIDAELDNDGCRWILTDTAGIRSSEDAIEKEGMVRSLSEIQLGDVLLYVLDSSRDLSTDDFKLAVEFLEKNFSRVILVFNKIDLGIKPFCEQLQKLSSRYVYISCTTGANVEQLSLLLKSFVEKLLDSGNAPFLLNQRQKGLVTDLSEDLNRIRSLMDTGLSYELLVVHIRELINHLGDFTGKSLSEEVLTRIFSGFCIGK